MRYIAWLRAINVGGNRIVKMEALREALAEFGLTGVRTYIQSGNAVFDAGGKGSRDPEALARRLEAHLEARFGFAIPTTLRSADQLAALIADLPAVAADEKLLISFLGGEHHPEARARLQALEQDGLRILLRPRELVLAMRQGFADKRLNSPNWVEKQLGTWTTGRNDRTLRKLHEMALTEPTPG